MALVCHCEAVSDRAVKRAIARGARSIDDITCHAKAGRGCGGCHEALEELLRRHAGIEPRRDVAQPA